MPSLEALRSRTRGPGHDDPGFFLMESFLQGRWNSAAAAGKTRRSIGRAYCFCSWRAMNALIISAARSVCGPGSATQRCSQPTKISKSHSPPAAR
jgi:hypothetical protein